MASAGHRRGVRRRRVRLAAARPRARRRRRGAGPRRRPRRRRLRSAHRRPGRDRRSGSGWDGRWTTAPPESCCPAWTAPRRCEAALTHLRYPPAGDRGVATYNRACRFGLDPGALDRADDETLCVVQIESAAAVAAVDEIAAVDGVDVLFIGPRDLSHDLGVPGDTTAPAFVEALDTVLAAAQAARQGLRDCSSTTAPPRPRGSHRAGRSSPSAPTPPCSPPTVRDRARPGPHTPPLTLARPSDRKKKSSWLDTSTPRASPSSASA